jgi:hypothetical protein
MPEAEKMDCEVNKLMLVLEHQATNPVRSTPGEQSSDTFRAIWPRAVGEVNFSAQQIQCQLMFKSHVLECDRKAATPSWAGGENWRLGTQCCALGTEDPDGADCSWREPADTAFDI